MLAQAQDKTPIIVAAALESLNGGRSCQVAEETLQLFFDILADEAANLVLKTLAFGGLFLGGGLAARLHGTMDIDRFCQIFARGTYQQRLAQVPIRLILNPETALIGAAAYGAQARICLTGGLRDLLFIHVFFCSFPGLGWRCHLF